MHFYQVALGTLIIMVGIIVIGIGLNLGIRYIIDLIKKK
jgi:hypothetical protein